MAERPTVERHRATAATITQRPLRPKLKQIDGGRRDNRAETEFRQICKLICLTAHTMHTDTILHSDCAHAILLVSGTDLLVVMRTGIITDATGSAYMEIANTKVLCGV
jgi:hypothetical protein